jgi:uncharacterized protein YbjT (DUF2867 family)
MNAPNPIVLVTGATGRQGGAVARHLLKRGTFAVRALVRDKNKPAAQALERAGAVLVKGEFNDRASLDLALQGAYGVFSVQSLNAGLEAEVRDGNALADAAKAAGVEHFVYSSVGGAERKTGIPHFESKARIEDHIRSSGLPYTILRPVFFFFNYDALRPMVQTGKLSQPLSAETRLQQLCEDDYGEMVADAFDRPSDFLTREIEVASVDMTMTETAAALSRATKTTVEYQQIPFEVFEQGAGKETTQMFHWFEDVGYGADLPGLKRAFSEPTGLESYLHDHGWAKPNESAPAAKSAGA